MIDDRAQIFELYENTDLRLNLGSIYGSRLSNNAHLILEANNDKTDADERIKFFVRGSLLASFMHSKDGYKSLILRPSTNLNISDGKLSFGKQDNFKKIALWDSNNDWYGLGMSSGEVRMQIGGQGGNRFSFYRGENKLLTIEKDGTVIAKRIKLDIGSFPDYVFENDYDLMPLEKVEAYIKANKHLPNMPSEAQVLKNGMDVGQINTILVEKVEELTLHTIAQQKHIKALKGEIAAFKAQLKEIKSLLKK
ncbi:hypothetical protein M23134_02688 [Microscilla marina ATCC 23134]|uniref:Uncharacterized protein n=2 Tax=Microscilla marina TaxID=1027 RepID=A1ZNY0_MICM2|nr:hypothetical protein M23134_02688 [Microscilla marina ATCC 23134]